ncbi:esterase/lipase family protein [Fodinicola feengrottensis]|uniref:esterase/lipase family protein n=1 Tax=Fodinicola feengrottensis TaxID=435914 RepID=UPI0013D27BB7|nr:alpha/beta fold hydrolase [Fodinicola feengrottensis]
MRALIRALATLFAVLTATAMAVPVAAAQAHLPVIFVHGFAHVSGQQHVFDNMVTQFESGGWTAQQLDVWTYDWKQSNVTTAQQLATEVDRLKKATGAAKVDIVAHSMGSLSSRYYLKSLGGTANVAHWVSLGGPNHGVSGAVLCGFYDSCDDMKAELADAAGPQQRQPDTWPDQVRDAAQPVPLRPAGAGRQRDPHWRDQSEHRRRLHRAPEPAEELHVHRHRRRFPEQLSR